MKDSEQAISQLDQGLLPWGPRNNNLLCVLIPPPP